MMGKLSRFTFSLHWTK